ncbi:MAG: B12-binding domain-containing radical SAM protein [Chromatiales bacterium]|nr:B12-binding domain-containing radical SAM protein [Chromatiales bacterium]
MEPLPAAAIAGLTPGDVDIRFYDDRMEKIPYDEPTDAVAISLETYTAKRVYQIASEYRKRNIPVIVGGFHASLVPEEAERFAESVIVGEAEAIWPTVIDDLRHGTLKKRYQGFERPLLEQIKPDRSIFRGKRYLPIGLVETGRGCRFPCEFCAIQAFFDRTHRTRPVDNILAELHSLKSSRKVFFFVDDNFAGNMQAAKPLLSAMAPMNIRWITQMSINAAHDEEFLELLSRSGCKGVLIGFESLDRETLRAMKKNFNAMRGGYEVALRNLRKYNIRVYGTFVFGYENDTHATFENTVDFAIQQRLYIAAFNHLTPFPGTASTSACRTRAVCALTLGGWTMPTAITMYPLTPWGYSMKTSPVCALRVAENSTPGQAFFAEGSRRPIAATRSCSGISSPSTTCTGRT